MPAKLYLATMKSVSPYCQNAKIQSPRAPQETADAHERRCWKERLHVTGDGNVFIPPMAFKNALTDAAKFLGKQIPGKGKATYKKIFEAGVLIFKEVVLQVKADDVRGQWLFLPADGVRGSGKRVDKCMPVIDSWEAEVEVNVLHDLITEDILREHLECGGMYIGLGNFRPQSGGYYGRYELTSLALGGAKKTKAA